MRSGLSGASGKIGCDWSSTCVWLFSSTHRTIAFSGNPCTSQRCHGLCRQKKINGKLERLMAVRLQTESPLDLTAACDIPIAWVTGNQVNRANCHSSVVATTASTRSSSLATTAPTTQMQGSKPFRRTRRRSLISSATMWSIQQPRGRSRDWIESSPCGPHFGTCLACCAGASRMGVQVTVNWQYPCRLHRRSDIGTEDASLDRRSGVRRRFGGLNVALFGDVSVRDDDRSVQDERTN